MVSRGCASNCSSSEMATPIRARPKSRARIGFKTRVISSVTEDGSGEALRHIAGSFDFAQDDGPSLSLQFRRKSADQVFDSFRFVPMTNQKSIWRTDDDQIMHAE